LQAEVIPRALAAQPGLFSFRPVILKFSLMRSTRRLICLAALAVLTACNRSVKQDGGGAALLRPLNVVVVTIDTLRPDHLHCYGSAKLEPPAVDSVAPAGVLFETAVTQTPLTPPSHASIFTGLYPTVHHVRDTGGFVLQPGTTTLATILQAQGWDTGAFV